MEVRMKGNSVKLELKRMEWEERMRRSWRDREEPDFGGSLYVHGKEFVLLS